jgi:hypothetical protein
MSGLRNAKVPGTFTGTLTLTDKDRGMTTFSWAVTVM